MGKARKLGIKKAYVPNSKADAKYAKNSFLRAAEKTAREQRRRKDKYEIPN